MENYREDILKKIEEFKRASTDDNLINWKGVEKLTGIDDYNLMITLTE